VRAVVLQHFGSCDILVNNAGIPGAIEFSISGLKKMDAIIDVNLKGPIYLARCLVPSMIQAGKGAHCQHWNNVYQED